MMPDPTMQPAAADMPMAKTSEICVPVSSLAMDGEDGKPVNPEVGDPVEVMVTGTVSKVEGDNVYFTLESANGDPITPEAEPADTMADPDESALRAMAATADEEL